MKAKSEYELTVNKFLDDRGIVYQAHHVGVAFTPWGNQASPKDCWACSLYRADSQQAFVTEFWSNNEPSAYDFLSAIQKNEIPLNKYEFFKEFGYEANELNERTHLAVLEEYRKISTFFTASELEELNEIAV